MRKAIRPALSISNVTAARTACCRPRHCCIVRTSANVSATGYTPSIACTLPLSLRGSNSYEVRRRRIEAHLTTALPSVLDEQGVADALFDLRALKNATLTSAFISKHVLPNPARLQQRVFTLAVQQLQQCKLHSDLVKLMSAALRENSSALNEVNLTVALAAMRSVGRIDDGLVMMRDVLRREGFRNNVVLQNAYLSLLSKSRSVLSSEALSEAEVRVAELMEAKAPVSPGTFAPLIILCGKVKRYDLAVKYHESMLSIQGLTENSYTSAALMTAASYAGNHREVLRYFREMVLLNHIKRLL